jgi:hypothetical protein
MILTNNGYPRTPSEQPDSSELCADLPGFDPVELIVAGRQDELPLDAFLISAVVGQRGSSQLSIVHYLGTPERPSLTFTEDTVVDAEYNYASVRIGIARSTELRLSTISTTFAGLFYEPRDGSHTTIPLARRLNGETPILRIEQPYPPTDSGTNYMTLVREENLYDQTTQSHRIVCTLEEVKQVLAARAVQMNLSEVEAEEAFVGHTMTRLQLLEQWLSCEQATHG